ILLVRQMEQLPEEEAQKLVSGVASSNASLPIKTVIAPLMAFSTFLMLRTWAVMHHLVAHQFAEMA
ncbi:MAG: hypothetical protein JWM16_2793, partial [Verrucomicrobiales bacterium]|nr:hypothetical protein [Verrucomicrobiales bacterium]